MKKLKKLTIGMLDELAKCQQIIPLEEQQSLVGGGDGSRENPYTMDEYYFMMDRGTWSGGYFTDSSTSDVIYGLPDSVRCYGSQSGIVLGYDTYNVADYIRTCIDSGFTDFFTQILWEIVGKIPGASLALGNISKQMTEMKLDIAADCSEKGYGANDQFDVCITKVGDVSYQFKAFDVKTGVEITSYTINVLTGSY